MAPPPLLALRDVWLTFGGTPLFTGVTLSVSTGEKICLVGRNGSGKSTLLKILAGQVATDGGERYAQPGLRMAYMPQDPPDEGKTVWDYVSLGLPQDERDQTWRIDAILDSLKLDATRDLPTLSGGEGRRAALARVLVGEPEALLLDEPTNHLDLPTIIWLEDFLINYAGALVVISHDRRFLDRISKQCLWLDEGTTRRLEQGFTAFPAWQEEVYNALDAELDRTNNRMRQELHWLSRGVTARRKRNMGRLRALHTLRDERSQRKTSQLDRNRRVTMEADSGDVSGRLVIEAKEIGKSYDGTIVAENFSTRILRGDRVGLIGPNGAGKTTLLKMLIGEIAPDSGTIRLGTNLEVAVFDQKIEQLDPEKSVWDILTDGRGDQIWVRGQPRHVVGYMKDFLFQERQAKTPLKALSGGERNRVLLAKILAKTANLLVLDEPTNDLDMDTLDLLEETLADYSGTLLVVSHDRDFLDRLVTSVIAVEGNGEVKEYVGGYSDYLDQRPKPDPVTVKLSSGTKSNAERPQLKTQKLSYKDQRELDGLPAKIEALGLEITKLEADLNDGTLYTKDPARFQKSATRLDAAKMELDKAEERWLELETLKQDLQK
jgi:ATP-binding cassette subfamily F protein uup